MGGMLQVYVCRGAAEIDSIECPGSSVGKISLHKTRQENYKRYVKSSHDEELNE